MGKRIVNAYKSLDKNQAYSLKDAVKIVKENAKAKFDETIDIAINLGVDPKYADQMVRGVCSLPHGTGKKIRVAVLAQGEKADQAKAAGADIVGAESLIDSILSGKNWIVSLSWSCLGVIIVYLLLLLSSSIVLFLQIVIK